MTLLYVVIWRFHALMGLPPAHYLQAPTMTFVFVFIALRALRYDPRFVLVAGAAAILGWAVMVANAVLGDPTGLHIGGSIADQQEGNVVILGAELEKMLAMMLTTLIIGLSIYRGRALLVRATTETMAAKRLSRFFDSSIAQDIRSGDSPIRAGEGRARDAAIMNVDIRGFSGLIGHLPPSEAISILTAYQRRVVPIIQANGGVIDKFMGDGIMATFGAVRPSPHYAADALRAMEAIMADAGSWRDDPQLAQVIEAGIGLSVSAGSIVFGAVGDSDRLEVTVVGSTVNLAAKLEKANKIFGSEAIASRAAYDMAVRQGYQPTRVPRLLEAKIDGVAAPLAIAVWDRTP